MSEAPATLRAWDFVTGAEPEKWKLERTRGFEVGSGCDATPWRFLHGKDRLLIADRFWVGSISKWKRGLTKSCRSGLSLRIAGIVKFPGRYFLMWKFGESDDRGRVGSEVPSKGRCRIEWGGDSATLYISV